MKPQMSICFGWIRIENYYTSHVRDLLLFATLNLNKQDKRKNIAESHFFTDLSRKLIIYNNNNHQKLLDFNF